MLGDQIAVDLAVEEDDTCRAIREKILDVLLSDEDGGPRVAKHELEGVRVGIRGRAAVGGPRLEYGKECDEHVGRAVGAEGDEGSRAQPQGDGGVEVSWFARASSWAKVSDSPLASITAGAAGVRDA